MTAGSVAAWRLDAPGVTWVFAAEGGKGLPACVYWGPALAVAQDLGALVAALRPTVAVGSLDDFVPLSLCPEAARGWLGHPGLVLSTEVGPLWPRFRLDVAEEVDGGLRWMARDAEAGLTLVLSVRLDPQSGVLAAGSELTADRPVRLAWLSAPVLPAPDVCTDVLDFSGRWTSEFQPQRLPLRLGAHVREGRDGRTGHATPPYAAVLTPGTTMTGGLVLGVQLAWSGGHRLVVEELPDGRRQVQVGALLHPGEIDLQAGAVYRSPILLAAVSVEGLGGVARAFHRHLRRHVLRFPDPVWPRPVHYNCWEAVYFGHSLQALKEIAGRAAALGAERFVLDDGWFHGRTDDRRALGDWKADVRKYPRGLQPLIDHVNGLGLEFGLWVEPEMVSVDSDLYRAHPDWVLGGSVDRQPAGRQQFVLDLSRPVVAEHVFVWLDSLLTAHRIAYLKWDHNRPLVGATAAQTEAVYGLLARLRAVHPRVEIESCASGGGRLDAGILAHTHRVWLSDSNDALVRVSMQHWAALMLPPEVTGAHVGPSPCHTSGRILPMVFRAWVAAQRHMGFELDPRTIATDDAVVLRRVTDWWKANRDWMLAGDLFPLDTPDPAVVAELHRATDGTRFVVFAAVVAEPARSAPRSLPLAGLDPDVPYRLRLIEADLVDWPNSKAPCGLAASRDGLVLTGSALMYAGLALPLAHPATMLVIEGERVS